MIRTIAVLGAGTMGSRIAQLFAAHGYAAVLYDPNESALRAAGQRMQLPEKTEAPLTYTSDLYEAVRDADLILEAAPEQLELKRALYAQIAPAIKPDAIVASNTSTYPLAALTSGIDFADRFIIAHFFNPAHLIPLVELVRSETTRPGIVEAATELLDSCGKVPVLLRKDIPGFIANRLQAALFREACHLLEQGIADAEQIDTVVREGLGLRWAVSGPFETADLGGLDIWHNVAAHLFPELSGATAAPDIVRNKVKEGQLGSKTGNGFYSYGNSHAADNAAGRRDRILTSILQAKENDL